MASLRGFASGRRRRTRAGGMDRSRALDRDARQDTDQATERALDCWPGAFTRTGVLACGPRPEVERMGRRLGLVVFALLLVPGVALAGDSGGMPRIQHTAVDMRRAQRVVMRLTDLVATFR